MECPICSGKLKKENVKEVMYGVDLGEFPANVCLKCGESFSDEETTRKMEAVAKEKGIFGLYKKTKVTQAGNSLAVRIPKEIVDFMKLKKGRELYIHPENNQIVVELVR